MISIVCFIGLFLVAIGASSAEAEDTHLQTLSVNGRLYTLPSTTPILLDDEATTLAALLGRAPGLQLRWRPSTVAGTRGGTPELVFSYTLIGTVTAVKPLQVLGQGVTITADTALEGFDSVEDLAIGDAMIIAGLVDANGSLYATLVERRGAQGNKYLVNGYVQTFAVAEPRLQVGEQWFDTSGIGITDCPGGAPANGAYMTLRADSIPGFSPGDVIDTLVEAACASPVPPGTAGASGFLEGIITAVPDEQTFAIGPLLISHGVDTVFEYGGPDDLGEGVDVSIEGTFADTWSFVADSIEFVRPMTRFEAPMQPQDITPGQSLRPFGVAVAHSAQVRDEDGILADGLTSPTQVEVRAWIDSSGALHATRVRERGDPDAGQVKLRGPVEQITPPTFLIQGLLVDSSSAVFLDGDANPITAKAFFEALRINQVVNVNDAVWHADTGVLTGGELTSLGYDHTAPVPGKPGAIVSGSVTDYGRGDAIFGNGFQDP